MSYLRELDHAISLARRAGDLALRYFSRETATEEKADRSPVTEADRACEALITSDLSVAFPADGIVGEEGAFRTSSSGRRWLVDPIDGTRDFVRRNSFWSVQIALQEAGEVVAGLIHFPCLGETYHAAAGEGAYCNGVRCLAAPVSDIGKAILMVSGFASAWEKWPAEAIRHLTRHCWTVRCYGGCYDIAMLSRGKADIWLSGSGMEWDYAPARIIAGECGAAFFTRDGSRHIDAGNCVICSPALEPELRRLLQVPS
jgi:fructose-1,6-bisphosphatase/inositol monophosphatase family enzyme